MGRRPKTKTNRLSATTKRNAAKRRKKPLTAKQAAVLDAIKTAIRTRSMPPTQLEILELIGHPKSAGVTAALRALEAKSYIKRVPRLARGIQLVTGRRKTATGADEPAKRDRNEGRETPDQINDKAVT